MCDCVLVYVVGPWSVFTGHRNVFQRQGAQTWSQLVLIWLKSRLFTSLVLPLFVLFMASSLQRNCGSIWGEWVWLRNRFLLIRNLHPDSVHTQRSSCAIRFYTLSKKKSDICWIFNLGCDKSTAYQLSNRFSQRRLLQFILCSIIHEATNNLE